MKKTMEQLIPIKQILHIAVYLVLCILHILRSDSLHLQAYNLLFCCQVPGMIIYSCTGALWDYQIKTLHSEVISCILLSVCTGTTNCSRCWGIKKKKKKIRLLNHQV